MSLFLVEDFRVGDWQHWSWTDIDLDYTPSEIDQMFLDFRPEVIT
jgi:hypothetical protein